MDYIGIFINHILSAILNGFFSAAEIAMDGGNKKAEVKAFKDSHPLFYAHSENGGLRNTTVHVRHIKPDHSGYIPPKGDSVNFSLRKTPKIVNEKQGCESGTNFHLGPYFYLNIDGEYKRIIDLVDKHFLELKNYIATI